MTEGPVLRDIPLKKAQDMLLGSANFFRRTEKVLLHEAFGRVLAHDVGATRSVPPFNCATADGFALRSADVCHASVENPVELKILGARYPGEHGGASLLQNECIQVAAGAELPEGADCVVDPNSSEIAGNSLVIKRYLSIHQNFTALGKDIRAGTTLLEARTTLDPGKIGALASQGISTLVVYAQPRVAIISTGDEIAPLGVAARPWQKYDTNGIALAALVKENGGLPVILPVMPDNAILLKIALTQATVSHDIVVISGGTSFAERDLTGELIQNLGEVIFHGVQVHPGGNQVMFATLKGRAVLALPGSPSACLLNGYLLLVPALRRLAHLGPSRTRLVQATLSKDVPARRIPHSVPVKVTRGKAQPVSKKASDITGASLADGFITIAENQGLPRDTEVTVELF